VALLDAANGSVQTRVVPCRVHFRTLDDARIERYLMREKPYDCAGSAKAEGLGIALIARIETDDPTSLIGLPLIALTDMLEGSGFVPLVGPSSITLALMASGLEGQRVAFCGYLPRDSAERSQRIKQLEQRSRRERETEIFIETPYRNDALFAALLEGCAPATRLCVAADLTLATESIHTRSVAEWRRARTAIGKRPAVFLLLA